MRQSYVVRNEIDQVLQIRPYDRQWTWTNSLQHGTPLTFDDAIELQARLRGGNVDEARGRRVTRIVEDYHNRTPYPLFTEQKVSGL